jgi:beta-N-acetylhexosaminidase
MALSLRQKLGQLFIVGFHGQTFEDPWVKSLSKDIEKGEVGGVILFSYNIKRPSSLRKLTRSLIDIKSPLPLLTSIDQEGGQVQRLQPANGFQGSLSAETVSSLSLESAHCIYLEMAKELRQYNINLNFAPCTDLTSVGSPCPVIGGLGRSYGTNPEQVISYGKTVLDAFQEEGIFGCIKHFPGHGSAQGDSHAGFVDVTNHWHEKELLPFFGLIKDTQVDMVMTAHIFNEKLDPKDPATLSKPTLTLLRDKGYDGIIISDDLHMGAIQAHYTVEEAALKALNAGCDMIILSNNKAAAGNINTFEPSLSHLPMLLDFLEDAVSSGSLPESRIEEAFHRVQRLKEKMA